jgi:hypothetical protein
MMEQYVMNYVKKNLMLMQRVYLVTIVTCDSGIMRCLSGSKVTALMKTV